MSALDSIRQRATKALFDYTGECACHEAYASRNLIDPDCAYHLVPNEEAATDVLNAAGVPALLAENARLLAALDAVEALCANVPDVQGHDCKFEGILLPSQVRTAITQALGEEA